MLFQHGMTVGACQPRRSVPLVRELPTAKLNSLPLNTKVALEAGVLAQARAEG